MRRQIFISVFFGAVFSVGANTLPLDSLEKIPPRQFQDRVIRYEYASNVSADSSLSSNTRAFALAADLFYSGKWEDAYRAYSALRGKDSLLLPGVLLRIAQTEFHLNRVEDAHKTLRLGNAQFSESKEWKMPAALFSLKMALADSTLRGEQKADSIEAFLKRYPKEKSAGELRYRAAGYLEKAKKFNRAKGLYLRVLTDSFEYGDSAFAAVRRLRERSSDKETPAEKISYARQICKRGDASGCILLTDSISFAGIKAEDKTLLSLWEARAAALRAENRSAEAIVIYQHLVDSIDARAQWLQSLIRLLRAENRRKESQAIDSIFQEKHKFSPENANNLWVRAFEHEQNKRYAQAIQTYGILDNPKFGKTPRREWAKFRIGYVYFIQEKYAAAENTFAEAAQQPFTWSASAAKMFLGITRLQLGKDSLAKQSFIDCIQDFPLGYYAHRSRELWLEKNPGDSAGIPSLSFKILSEDSTLAWIRSKQKNSAPVPGESERLTRVKKFLDAGFTEVAYALYEEARSRHGNRLDFLYEYGKLFLEAGETTEGYRLARVFQNNADRRIFLSAPLNVLRFLYPVPYREAVFKRTGDSVIDPYFVYSVMRQESTFDFEIISPAGARGLLQIMPATGVILAKKEKISPFTPSELFNPYLNIRLGARYLADLYTEYGDYMYVLGNYNAGPKPAKRWQAAGKGKSWDIRAEEISYWETRDYVKRVMGNYVVYQKIWKE
ncbi:MAG: lytic transglycosylase domain-containing protein [Fibrobacter sp.]|jgi:soluble lytic murein transglycosylase|nr:lytic transglycosylase domain-containing protein [Fibrobacter sp.]